MQNLVHIEGSGSPTAYLQRQTAGALLHTPSASPFPSSTHVVVELPSREKPDAQLNVQTLEALFVFVQETSPLTGLDCGGWQTTAENDDIVVKNQFRKYIHKCTPLRCNRPNYCNTSIFTPGFLLGKGKRLASPTFPGALWSHGWTIAADTDKWLKIQDFTNFAAAHSVVKCQSVNCPQNIHLYRLYLT